jgi:hypothetical protein
MRAYKKTIDVPKTPPQAFNPERPASTLLLSQALHLHEALKWHVARATAVMAVNPRTLRTEKDISDYCKKVTRLLHLHSPKRRGK